jgi:hypothetical protein
LGCIVQESDVSHFVEEFGGTVLRPADAGFDVAGRPRS